jgi:hypothetical protein
MTLLSWLTPEQSVADGTWGLFAATAALVVVTVLLVLDGSRKSREQIRRWEHEDKRREEEARPSAVVVIATYAEDSLKMVFACFNLGNHTFFIDKMIVTTTDGSHHESELTPQIVTPGHYVTIKYDPCELLAWFGESKEYKEANCTLLLRGATATVATEPVWFYVSAKAGVNGCLWYVGRLSERQPGVIPSRPKIIPMPSYFESS